MTPDTLTLISGVVLLLVFALVGLRVHGLPTFRDAKRRDRDEDESP